MPTETEIKIRLNSKERVAAVLSRCTRLYGAGNETLQRDEYFDNVDELLKEKDFTVRLRLVNGKAKIALKGPRNFFPDNIHNRLELEFSVVNEEEARDEIERQRLVPVAVLEKRRWKVKRNDLKVVIDTLPFIGSFLEIEAATPERITKIITLLGLSSDDSVRQNYTELMEEELTKLGLPLRPNLRATFEAESDHRVKRSL